jgi:hypothetical protein
MEKEVQVEAFQVSVVGAGVVGEEKSRGHFAMSNVSSNKNLFG